MKKQILFVILISCSRLFAQTSNSLANSWQSSWTQWTEKGFQETSVIEASVKKSGVTPDWEQLKIEHRAIMTPDQVKTKFGWGNKLTRIAIFGDTGCRLKEDKLGGHYQDCDDLKHWPYKQVIGNVAATKPQLIIHLGDYHYREQCSRGKICDRVGHAIGYGWEPWKLDFFEPSAAGFAVAPWIFVRGNHESCDRAEKGYHLLINNDDWKKDCLVYEKPNFMSWGDLLIVNIDTNDVSEFPDLSDQGLQLWTTRFDALADRIDQIKADAAKTDAPIKTVWLVTHKPFTGMVWKLGGYLPVNMNLRSYLEHSRLANKVDLLFAGHVHNSHVVQAGSLPTQMVVGNGGTMLDDFSHPLSQSNVELLKYKKAKIISDDFGFALLTRKDVSTPWSIEFHDRDGKKLWSCELGKNNDKCF